MELGFHISIIINMIWLTLMIVMQPGSSKKSTATYIISLASSSKTVSLTTTSSSFVNCISMKTSSSKQNTTIITSSPLKTLVLKSQMKESIKFQFQKTSQMENTTLSCVMRCMEKVQLINCLKLKRCNSKKMMKNTRLLSISTFINVWR